MTLRASLSAAVSFYFGTPHVPVMEIGREMIHCPNVPCLAIEEIFAKFLCII
jgi:hypothetical protein